MPSFDQIWSFFVRMPTFPPFGKAAIAVIATLLYLLLMAWLFRYIGSAAAPKPVPDAREMPNTTSRPIRPPAQPIAPSTTSTTYDLAGKIKLTVEVAVTLGSNASLQRAVYDEGDGNYAEIESYVLFADTYWKLGSPTEIEHPDKVEHFFSSGAFADDLPNIQAIVSLGLASHKHSGSEKHALQRGEELSGQRALAVGSLISGILGDKPRRPLLFGVGLGMDLYPADDETDASQRTLVVLAIKGAHGRLNTEAGRKQMIRNILEGGGPHRLDHFNPAEYALVAGGKRPLLWLQIDPIYKH